MIMIRAVVTNISMMVMKHYDNDGADDGVVCNDDDNDEETKMVKIITRKGC
jgi:hypothetical protein